jgi:hypothetical protein
METNLAHRPSSRQHVRPQATLARAQAGAPRAGFLLSSSRDFEAPAAALTKPPSSKQLHGMNSSSEASRWFQSNPAVHLRYFRQPSRRAKSWKRPGNSTSSGFSFSFWPLLTTHLSICDFTEQLWIFPVRAFSCQHMQLRKSLVWKCRRRIHPI